MEHSQMTYETEAAFWAARDREARMIATIERPAAERYADTDFIPSIREEAPRVAAGGRHWELTGGSSGYYKVEVTTPATGPTPYLAECNDIIEALHMNFAEGNAFKAIWRSAAARLGNGKPGTTALYDAEKVVFFGGRMEAIAKRTNEG